MTTGLGEQRNALIVASCDVLVAVGAGYGTLSEVAMALKAGRPVVSLWSWAIDGVIAVESAREAGERALALARERLG